MDAFGERLYRVSWGFAILWLGISIIVGYSGGFDILGVYLSGIGIYGLVVSFYAYSVVRDKIYLIALCGSIISVLIGASVLTGGLINFVVLMGIILITIGVMVIVYYLI